jgi:hypothetical protein
LGTLAAAGISITSFSNVNILLS